MPRPVGSAGQRKAAAELDRESKISEAVDLANKGVPHRLAGQKLGIPPATVWHRQHGRRNRRKAHTEEQSLSVAEEDEIIEWLKELDRWRLHLRRGLVIQRAQSILESKAARSASPLSTHVGVNWFTHFLKRHPDLRTALSQRKDISRSKAEHDPVRMAAFYTNLSHAYAPPYNIKPENLYNVDEKGFMMGISAREHVVVFRRTEMDRKMGRRPNGPLVPQDGNREIVTVIDCVCADGSVLSPFIIMKGKRPAYAWAKDSELEKAWIAASPNGWTDNELGVNWVEKLFEPETRDKANGNWRGLVLDNQESHVSAAFIEACLQNRILCIGLPPKTSGISQPLDVSCFKPYQLAYGRAADDEVRSSNRITKQDFPRLLPRARAEAFTCSNIVRGFEQTGIFPFNDKYFPYVRDFYAARDREQLAGFPHHSPASQSSSPTPPPYPRANLRNDLITRVRDLSASPPATPTRAVKVAKDIGYEFERAQTRIILQGEQIRELQNAEKGRTKKGDRHKVPVIGRAAEHA
ncbi:CENP-B protein [Mycena venus]|uniref:CENP-B protein n=1 Tax=Mycena venus TaxID=2733690 RepID=A0A8H6X6Y3_9AGAR|nr:CENP-B protein [Mycena venus]